MLDDLVIKDALRYLGAKAEDKQAEEAAPAEEAQEEKKED